MKETAERLYQTYHLRKKTVETVDGKGYYKTKDIK